MSDPQFSHYLAPSQREKPWKTLIMLRQRAFRKKGQTGMATFEVPTVKNNFSPACGIQIPVCHKDKNSIQWLFFRCVLRNLLFLGMFIKVCSSTDELCYAISQICEMPLKYEFRGIRETATGMKCEFMLGRRLCPFWDLAMTHHNIDSSQLRLNLAKTQFVLVKNRTTRKVAELVKEITGEFLSSEEILKQGKAGAFEVTYPYGILTISPSERERSNRLWRWDVSLVPTVMSQRSA